jgi:hypothetical protein
VPPARQAHGNAPSLCYERRPLARIAHLHPGVGLVALRRSGSLVPLPMSEIGPKRRFAAPQRHVSNWGQSGHAWCMLETTQLTCFVFSCSPNKTATGHGGSVTLAIMHSRHASSRPRSATPAASTNAAAPRHCAPRWRWPSSVQPKDELLSAGDAGVEQITLQHGVVLRHSWNHCRTPSGRADAPDHAGREVLLDAVGRGRGRRSQKRLELLAVRPIVDPFA